MRNFEEFTGRATPVASNIPRVAIQKRGNMSLNKAAYKALGEPGFVVLLYDSGTNSIGLRPSQGNVRHAYPVRKQPNSQSYLVAGHAFCRFYGIDTGFTRAFEPSMEDGILVVELDQGVAIERPARTSQSTRAETGVDGGSM